MAPKKKVEEVKKVKFGRPGNTLRMGLVGLPNVGKSTTFNVLTKVIPIVTLSAFFSKCLFPVFDPS